MRLIFFFYNSSTSQKKSPFIAIVPFNSWGSPFGTGGMNLVFHPRRKQNGSCFTDPLYEPLDSPPYGFGHFYSFNIANMGFRVNSSQENFTIRSKKRLVRKTKKPPFWRVFAMRFSGLGVLFSQKAPQKRPLISCSGTLPGYGRARTPCCLFSRKRRSACTNPR